MTPAQLVLLTRGEAALNGAGDTAGVQQQSAAMLADADELEAFARATAPRR